MAVIAAAIAALLLATADAGADGGSGPRPGAGAGRADAGAPAAEARDAGGADAGPALDPADEDLIRHLDEVERQELLQHLELFEEADGEGAPRRP